MKAASIMFAFSGIALAAGAAIAAPQPRDAVSVAVSSDGLDLATQDGVSALEGRMARAIGEACSGGERLNTGLSPDWRCRKELHYSAQQKIAGIRANAGQPNLYASVITLDRAPD